jgi:hypothetical protein
MVLAPEMTLACEMGGVEAEADEVGLRGYVVAPSRGKVQQLEHLFN